MGVCTINPIRESLNRAIEYIIDPKKNSDTVPPSFSDIEFPENAAEEMLKVRQELSDYQLKHLKTLAQHLRQSFKPGEVTPEQAHEIGEKLCKKLFGQDYKFVIATHVDKKHIHNHIIVNHINTTHLKALNSNIQFYWQFRKASDELCKEYGLSVISEKRKEEFEKLFLESQQNYSEFLAANSNVSWTLKLKFAIDRAIENSNGDYSKFILAMENLGYEVKDDTLNKDGKRKYISFKHKNQKRFLRASAKRLGKDYTRESILERLENKDYKLENVITEKDIAKQKEAELLKFKEQEKHRKVKRYVTMTDKIKESYGLSQWAMKQNRIAVGDMLLFMDKIKSQGKNFFDFIDELEKRHQDLNIELKQIKEQQFFLKQYHKHLENLEATKDIFEEYDYITDPQIKKNFELVYKSELKKFNEAQKFLETQKQNPPLTPSSVLSEFKILKEKEKAAILELQSLKEDLKEIHRFKENLKKMQENER